MSIPEILADAEWGLVPFHMHEPIKRYVLYGTPGGGFLECVLINDLSGAVARADAINRVHLAGIVNFLQWHIPAIAWGSPENYAKWVNRGGLEGMTINETGKQDAGDTDPAGPFNN